MNNNYKACIPMTYSVVYLFASGWHDLLLTLNTTLCFTKPHVVFPGQCLMWTNGKILLHTYGPLQVGQMDIEGKLKLIYEAL